MLRGICKYVTKSFCFVPAIKILFSSLCKQQFLAIGQPIMYQKFCLLSFTCIHSSVQWFFSSVICDKKMFGFVMYLLVILYYDMDLALN